MSDQKKIEDLFAQQRSKKQKNQKAKPTASGQTATTSTKRDDDKKEDPPAAKQTQQQDFAESSDEETKIELDEKTAVIKDAKEVEASKRKEHEKEQQDLFGWGGLDKKSNQQTSSKPVAAEAKPTKASGAGMADYDGLKATTASRTGGDIKFKSSGPQQFNNKSKKSQLNQQEFPELGASSGPAKQEAPVSKKDGQYNFPATSFAAQANKNAAAEEAKEAKSEPKMPVFTRKVKVTTDDSQRIENIPQSQTYDFSKMKMSQASSKPSGPRPEGEAREIREGERTRGDYRGRGRGGFEGRSDRPARAKEDSEDSFEEVKDKRKPQQQFQRGSKTQN